VGDGLKINALTDILSLFIGAAVWGLAGMILFLPFAAMLKVVCEEFEELKPIALIIKKYKRERWPWTIFISMVGKNKKRF
jgi:predicted PurR-regulated permease PerM